MLDRLVELSSIGAILAPPIVMTEPWFRHHSHKSSFITCYDVFQEVFIDADMIKQFLTDVNTVCFRVFLSKLLGMIQS